MMNCTLYILTCSPCLLIVLLFHSTTSTAHFFPRTLESNTYSFSVHSPPETYSYVHDHHTFNIGILVTLSPTLL